MSKATCNKVRKHIRKIARKADYFGLATRFDRRLWLLFLRATKSTSWLVVAPKKKMTMYGDIMRLRRVWLCLLYWRLVMICFWLPAFSLHWSRVDLTLVQMRYPTGVRIRSKLEKKWIPLIDSERGRALSYGCPRQADMFRFSISLQPTGP